MTGPEEQKEDTGNNLREASDSTERQDKKGAGVIRGLITKHAGKMKDAFAAVKNNFENARVHDGNYLVATDITPDELEKSTIPNELLSSASVYLTSDSGIDYKLSYLFKNALGAAGGIIPTLGCGISVSVVDSDKKFAPVVNREDYEKVSAKLMEMNNVPKKERDKGIPAINRLSEYEIGGQVNKYQEQFPSVSDLELRYNFVSPYRAQHSGLPEDKLKYIDRPVGEAVEAAKEVSLNKQEGSVSLYDLTPDELEKSGITVNQLQKIHTSFSSKSDIKYNVDYNYEDIKGTEIVRLPFISVWCPVDGVNDQDFAAVAQFISEITKSKAGEVRRGTDLQSVRLKQDIGYPTVEEIAEFMRKYNDKFKDVDGAYVDLSDVSRNDLKEMNIPSGKLGPYNF